MDNLFNFFSTNPTALVSVISATIGALVALLVFLTTQLLNSRRIRSQILIPKLEELYSLLDQKIKNQFPATRLLFDALIDRDEEKIKLAKDFDVLEELVVKDTNSRIRMLVKLYFPALENIYNKVSDFDSEFVELVLKYQRGERVKIDDILELSNKSSKYSNKLRDEIANNCKYLVGVKTKNNELPSLTSQNQYPTKG